MHSIVFPYSPWFPPADPQWARRTGLSGQALSLVCQGVALGRQGGNIHGDSHWDSHRMAVWMYLNGEVSELWEKLLSWCVGLHGGLDSKSTDSDSDSDWEEEEEEEENEEEENEEENKLWWSWWQWYQYYYHCYCYECYCQWLLHTIYEAMIFMTIGGFDVEGMICFQWMKTSHVDGFINIP